MSVTATELPAAEKGPSPEIGRRRWTDPLTIACVSLAVLLAAAVAGLVVEFSHNRSLEHINSLRASALATAERLGKDFGSYTYTDLHGPQAPWTVIEQNSDEKFSQAYAKTAALLEPNVVNYKASATAVIPTAAVSSVSGTRAVVLMLLDQTITNSTQKNGPQTQNFFITMTLVRQGGRWVIDDVSASV